MPERPRSTRGGASSPRTDGPRHERHEPELRLHGLHACLAAFARRPADLRKAYLSAQRIAALRPLLAYCVANRIGYRVVEDEDLRRLCGSAHHEGVVLDMRRPRPPDLDALLARDPAAPALLVYLDGVGNPHNLGAVLRSAAHFGVRAVLVDAASGLALSGAACRVAEGGAEAVPLLPLSEPRLVLQRLRAAGYVLAATLPRGGADVFRSELPDKLVLVFGAEREGMSRALAESCELRLGIPGSGAVESLNVASAAAVLLAEWRRRYPT